MDPFLSVVVPVYNEEDNLVPLYERTRAALEPLGVTWELILVDDGSRDGSPVRLEELCLRDPRVRAVLLRKNFGQTAAMAAGFDHARGEAVVTMDADLQNDPNDIGRMLERFREGYDVVSGWRKHRKDDFLVRTLPSRLANSLISKMTGVHLHDYGCTLKVYRKEVLTGLRLYGEMHRFLPALVAHQGARITEMEVTHHPRLHGVSKYGIGRSGKVVLDLLTVIFLGSYVTKPIYVFGGAGAGMVAGGLGVAALMLWWKLVDGISMILTPLPVLSAMLIIVGIQFLGLGLLAELVVRTYHESQQKRIYTVRKLLP